MFAPFEVQNNKYTHRANLASVPFLEWMTSPWRLLATA